MLSLNEVKQRITDVLRQMAIAPDESKQFLEGYLSVLSAVGSSMRLREHSKSNANDIKSHLGFPQNYPAKQFRSCVKKAMTYWGIKLIDLGHTNSNWKLLPAPCDVENQLQPFWRYIESQPNAMADGPIEIRLGCGSLLIPFFSPGVITAFRRSQPNDGFEVTMIADTPKKLTESLEQGGLDLIVTSFEDSYQSKNKIKFFGNHLQMHLCVARRSGIDFGEHATLDVDRFRKVVAGKRVVTMTPERTPSLCPANDVWPDSVRHEAFNSWIEVIGMGLAGNDTCCVAYPQIFTPEDRANFRTIPLEGGMFPKLRLGVARYLRGEGQPAHQRILEGLATAFAEKISESQAEDQNGASHQLCAHFNRTAHVSHDGQGKSVWVHGEIRDLAVTGDGYLQADHYFEIPWLNKHVNLAISGHLATGNQGTHLTWRGYDDSVSWKSSRESYVVSFSASTEDAYKNHRFAVGVWSGRASWENVYSPLSGYFVLYAGDLLTDTELTARLKNFKHVHRLKPSFEIPSDSV